MVAAVIAGCESFLADCVIDAHYVDWGSAVACG